MKKPASQKTLWTTALLFAATGMALSVYSAITHYKSHADPLYSSFCAISRAINCDTVAQSPWSIFLGIPVAWWGLLFQLAFMLLLLTGNYRCVEEWKGLLFVSLAASAAVLALAVVSVWKVKSICLICLAIYAATFSLAYVCWLGWRRSKEAGDSTTNGRKLLRIGHGIAAGIFLAGLLLLHFFLPRYWLTSFSMADVSRLPHGLTEEGHPWIGAEKPVLTIEQFSDYQCFQCRKMHFFLRRLLLAHPTSLRLVHRNYPMDHAVNPQVVPKPFHQGSGDLAKIAILAALRDKFWSTSDQLYELAHSTITDIPLQDIADKTGLDKRELAAALVHPNIKERLRRDIWRGMKLGITGTPAFLIDGAVYQGQVPAEVLEKISGFSKK